MALRRHQSMTGFRCLLGCARAVVRDARTIGELRDLRHALDTASIVVITGPDGIIRHMNDRFCRIS